MQRAASEKHSCRRRSVSSHVRVARDGMHSCSSALIVTPRTALNLKFPQCHREHAFATLSPCGDGLAQTCRTELYAWWTALSSGLTGRPGWHGSNRGWQFTHSLHNFLHSQGLCLTHGIWLSIIQQVCCHISDAPCHTGMARAVESQLTCTCQHCVHGM